MASTHIEIRSTASRLGSDYRTAITCLQNAVDLYEKIKDISDQVAAGGDWAALAAKLGFSDDQDGYDDAQAVYNLLGSVVVELNATFIPQWLARLG